METVTTATQSDKATRFQALHQGPGAFVIPNPWDAGSARILAGLGFQALATSSGASASILGRRDGKVTREEALGRMSQALDSFIVEGVTTTIPFLRTVIDHPEFAAGAVDTKFLERNPGLMAATP